MADTMARTGILISEVRSETVVWLWQHYIPLGKVCVLEGDPGLGKSVLLLDIAARLSSGTAMPDGTPCVPGGVIVLSAEDGLADTVRPRLEAGGADLDRIMAIPSLKCEGGERAVMLPDDIPALENAIQQVQAKLVIIDPLVAFINPSISSWNDQQMRLALSPLAQLAQRTGSAIVAVVHLNKGEGRSAIYRGGGSIAIPAAARSVFLVANDPEDAEQRVLAGVKHNLAAMPPSLLFRTDEAPNGAVRIEWLGPTDKTATELLAASSPSTRLRPRDEAEQFLSDYLSYGPVPALEVADAAQELGISERTLDRAKKKLGVIAKRRGFGADGGWDWMLPGTAKERHSSDGPSMLEVAPYDEKSGAQCADDGWSPE